MAIQELEVFPQMTFSEGQGLIGTRKWTLDHNDDVMAFLDLVSTSHFPGYFDCLPISIQSGAFWDGVQVRSNCNYPRTTETMGFLPEYNKYQVVAQYALHRLTNCWPNTISKPWHPRGTTLTLKVKGSGQYLIITPAGMKPALLESFLCSEDAEAISPGFVARFIVPIAEYHVTCGRMTKENVEGALAMGWDEHLGTVNSNGLAELGMLSSPEGTLLFDGYEINETFIADPVDPLRWNMTAVFKKRIITDEDGNLMYDREDNPVGWNHDYINGGGLDGGGKSWGWTFIAMHDIEGNCIPRYPYTDLESLFGSSGSQPCDDDTEPVSPLPDSDICIPGPSPFQPLPTPRPGDDEF